MYKLKTIEKVVFDVLTGTPSARDNDMELYFLVCKEFFNNKHKKSALLFEYVMRNYNALGIPCFESVRRTRQKIQAAYPSLGCSPQKRRARHKEKGKYRHYAGEKITVKPTKKTTDRSGGNQ